MREQQRISEINQINLIHKMSNKNQESVNSESDEDEQLSPEQKADKFRLKFSFKSIRSSLEKLESEEKEFCRLARLGVYWEGFVRIA
jgi:hypothetical protein